MSILSRDQLNKLDQIISDMSDKVNFYINGNLLEVNDTGINYNLYSLVAYILGSLDYFNTIHVKSGIYNPSPVNLSYLEDPINFGYINADIYNPIYIDNTNGDLFAEYIKDRYGSLIAGWNINLRPPIPYWFHDGSHPNFDWGNQNSYITTIRTTYPDWNGWPEYDSESLENKYPVNFNNIRIPVMMMSKVISVINNDVSDITYDQTISLDAEQIINDSMWSDNYEDIRIFRIKETNDIPETDPGLPSAAFEEIAREIDATNLIVKFSISADNTISISPGDYINYVIYWRSPDNIISDFTLPTYPGDNEASDYSISEGQYYNYFHTYRNDVVEYKYNHQILKFINNTNYSSDEIDKNLYEPKDPIFYKLDRFDDYIDEYYNPLESQLNNPLYYYRGLSLNYRNQLGNYPDYDSVYGILISIKTYFDMNQFSKVYYIIEKGPEIFPDMFSLDWKDFTYYPKLKDKYIPFIKIVVGQKNTNEISQNSPRAKIIHLEQTKSYGFNGINNIEFVNSIYENINNIFDYFQNLNFNKIFSNNIFSTYFTFLSLDIDEIVNNQQIIDIFSSHIKYILSGDSSSLFENNNLFRNLDVNSVNQNIIMVSDDVASKSLELSSNDANIQPWYISLQYWKNPTNILHESDHFIFGNGSNWVVSNARNTDTSRIFIQYFPGDLDYDDNINVYNPNDSSTILQDRDNSYQTGLKLFQIENILASKFEIYFPEKSDQIDETSNAINQDYTFKFDFKDNLNNIISKELFIPNANFYISDAEYQQKVSDGVSVVGYLSPSIVWNDHKYQEYGEAYYMPNCRTETARQIFTKVFDSDKPGVKTIDEAIAECEQTEDPDGDRFKGGKDASDADISIRDCITDVRESEGIELVDLRTISNKSKGIDRFWLGITKYTATDPIWKNDYEYLGGQRDFDDDSGEFILQTRYGYRVDGLIFYQSFDKNEVITSRNQYINSHLQEDMIIKSQNRHEIFNDIDFSLNGTNNFLAQTFTADFATLSNKISTIQCWIQRVGSADASIILQIFDITANEPNIALAESVPVDFKSISEDGEWITFEFPDTSIDEEINRYSLVITSFEDPFSTFSVHNKLIWYFSDSNIYSYGLTSTYTFLSENVVAGSNYIIVEDASVFPDVPFFIIILGDLYYIISIEDNKLYFSEYDYQLDFDYLGNREYPEYNWYIGVISNDYSSGTMVSLVNFIPLDPENRFYKKKITEDAGIISGWLLPDYSNHDAAYRIFADAFDVGPVEEIDYNEWFGSDISDNSEKSLNVDSFYISGNSVEYDSDLIWPYHTSFNNQSDADIIPNDDPDPDAIQGFSWAGNLDAPIKNSKILGGFNVSGNMSFPSQNNVRVSNQNKIDRYWAFVTDILDVSDKIVVLPQALKRNNSSVEYIPLYNNVFLTIGLIRPNNTRKVINKVIYGYNNDYGKIVEVIDDTTFIVQSYAFANIDYNEFAGKTFKMMTGDASGSEEVIIRCYDSDAPGNYQYRIEILNDLKTIPSINDEYIISFSNTRMYDYGILTDVLIDLETGFTILKDNTKTWIDNIYNGYILWLVDGNVPNTQIVISDTLNSNELQITNLLIDPSIDTYYIILGEDESETGVYGTDSPIVIDDEKFIGVDHMYIDASNFPNDYNDGMGQNDSFLIRSKIDVSI